MSDIPLSVMRKKVFEEELIGGASIDIHKIPITDEVFFKSLIFSIRFVI